MLNMGVRFCDSKIMSWTAARQQDKLGVGTFQDVKEKVLPAEPILMLRCRIPSMLRRLTC